LANEMFATDAARFRDAFQVHRRFEMAAQIMITELDRVGGMRFLHLLAVERDEQTIGELRLVKTVIERPCFETREDLPEQVVRFGLQWHRNHRTEIGAKLRKHRTEG